MAKFVLEEGEQVILRERVVDTRADGIVTNELVVTDRRIVLIAERSPAGVFLLFGLLGGLLGAALKKTNVSHAIRRADFATAGLTGKKEFRVRSKGEGYGMTWFEVKALESTAEEWVARLHSWSAGIDGAVPPPTAKLVK